MLRAVLILVLRKDGLRIPGSAVIQRRFGFFFYEINNFFRVRTVFRRTASGLGADGYLFVTVTDLKRNGTLCKVLGLHAA